MKGKASKVGQGGLQPLVKEDIGGTRVDDVMLAQRGTGNARTSVEVSNGSVAAPIKGTRVAGAASLTGGSL